ncbi:POTRA domain-containing protein [Parachryseolinea silvisoli]|uniref:POTRA domain-containing protein n=1 Tax=Parachryseolinea silvisoli TaxID=2873601 RepID=UPI002265AD77|nr:POTRA domain-containing protein [Parachryseolinea silvisoli]MCD9014328.1 BamA/TamA family outer membrane protein [Parachryseolinea silvisoli]
MLAFIFGLFSLFLQGKDRQDAVALPAADSVIRPVRTRQLPDSAGRFLRINRIFIVGNRITRDPIVLRELSLKPGDYVFSQELPSMLELDKKKLINTRLFNTVEIRALEYDPNHVDLLVDVNERWYTFPSPIFELADRNFNEWWQNYNHDFSRVNYGLRLYQYNMRGRNETLRFTTQLGFTRRFNLSYRIPYIDRKQRQGLMIDLDFAQAKNLAYQTLRHKMVFLESERVLRTVRSGGLTYTYRPSFYQSHGFSVSYKSVSINDTIMSLNPNYLGEGNRMQQYGTITYQFTTDHRDYVGYPLRGYYLNVAATQNGIMKNDDIDKFEASLTATGFFDMGKNYFLSNNIVGFWSRPDDLPYYNYSALGYQKQVIRGYEIYVIEGPRFLLNKTTFKKRLFARTYHMKAVPIPQFRHIPLAIYLKAYGDVGYVHNYNNYTLSNQLTGRLLSGGGMGIDIVGSYDTVFRFEYTYNAEGVSGLFFNLKKEF